MIVPAGCMHAWLCMLCSRTGSLGVACTVSHNLGSLMDVACLQSLKQKEGIVAELAAASKAIESSSNRGAKLLIRCQALGLGHGPLLTMPGTALMPALHPRHCLITACGGGDLLCVRPCSLVGAVQVWCARIYIQP